MKNIAVIGAGPAGLFAALFAGLAIRALVFRVLATLCHLWQGVRRLPENWRENNFSTDSCLPAELMPGIRDANPVLALDGMIEDWRKDREGIMWLALRRY